MSTLARGSEATIESERILLERKDQSVIGLRSAKTLPAERLRRQETHELPVSSLSISTSTLPVLPSPSPRPNRPPKLTPVPPTIVTLSVRPSAC
jgi:hypothetical protein